MDIKINGISCKFHGSIGPVSSDNLVAHSIGGFFESFNSLRVCRICMGTSNDIQTKASNQIALVNPTLFQWTNNPIRVCYDVLTCKHATQ